MNKRVLKFISDVVSVPIIIIIAYGLKFKVGWVFQNVFNIGYGIIYERAQVEHYLDNILMVVLVWALSFYFMGVYQRYRGLMADVNEFIKLVKGISLAVLLIASLSLIYGIMPQSFFVFAYAWAFGIVLLTFNRVVINHFFSEELRLQRCCVLGVGEEAQEITERIIVHNKTDYFYVGSFAQEEPSELKYTIRKSFKYLGDFSSVTEYLLDEKIDCVYVVVPEFGEKNIDAFVSFCEWHSITVYLHYSLSAALSGVAFYEDLEGMPLVGYKSIEFSTLNTFLKRCFDVVFSLGILLFLSPVFLIISLWIKSVSPGGPVLFKQERVGIYHTLFDMLKFRTMHPDAEKKSGPVWVNTDDDRYIKGGKFLRRFSLDELPQLLNVIKGEMSLIGPRPERAFFVDQIMTYAPYFDLRHKVRGGLTGWAQIHGRAYMTRKPLDKFRYDLYYIKNWSLVLDFKILLKTVFVVLKGEEAY